MSLTTQERIAFLTRTSAWYQLYQHQANQAGQLLNFDLERVRWLVEKQLGPGGCPYCRGPVPAATFSLDPRTPLVRGGKITFRNLIVCCADCHVVRGVLDDTEFRDLMALLATWPRPVREHFLTRLRRSPLPANLPRVGSLEWFTGSEVAHDPPARASSGQGTWNATAEPPEPAQEPGE